MFGECDVGDPLHGLTVCDPVALILRPTLMTFELTVLHHRPSKVVERIGACLKVFQILFDIPHHDLKLEEVTAKLLRDGFIALIVGSVREANLLLQPLCTPVEKLANLHL